MTYVLVTDTGEIDVRPEPPTVDTFLDMIGDGAPELVRLPVGDRMVAWVNDNWISQVESGQARVNKVASVVHMTIGGDFIPLGGPVVFTSLRTEDGQFLPDDLDEEIAEALTVVATDAAAVLTGDGAQASFYADDEMSTEKARELEGEIRKALDEVESLPLRPLAGGFTPEKAAKAALDGLRSIGMPERLVQRMAEVNGIPYTEPVNTEGDRFAALFTGDEDARKDA